MQDQSWLGLCLSYFSLEESPERSGSLQLACTPTNTHSQMLSLCHSSLRPSWPEQFIWQTPCGLDAKYGVRLFYSEQALPSQQTCWSLVINRVLHQLAAMRLTYRCSLVLWSQPPSQHDTHHRECKRLKRVFFNSQSHIFRFKKKCFFQVINI